jgi:hypothetical protein
MKLFILMFLVCTLHAADLPQDAQAAVDRETAAETQLKTDCDAKVAKLHEALVKRLKTAQDAAVHRGDLDGAEAIKSKISVLGGGPSTLAPKEVSLTALQPISSSGPGQAVVKTEEDAHDHPPVLVDGQASHTFLWSHAPSVWVFPIPEGAKRFKAFGGSFSATGMRFLVAADGQVLFTSHTLSSYPEGHAAVDVAIPEGATKLTLTVDPQGSNNAAHSYWGNPVFVGE